MSNINIDKLIDLVEKSPKSKHEIAENAQINITTLWRILSKKRPLNSCDTLFGLAKALNVNPSYLFSDMEWGLLSENDYVVLPVFKGFNSSFEDIATKESSEMMPTPRSMVAQVDNAEQHCFWIEIIGNVFAPKINHGDQVLLARDQMIIQSGSLVAAVTETADSHEHAGEAQLKRFKSTHHKADPARFSYLFLPL